MAKEPEALRSLADRLEQLMTLDIACRGVIKPLYESATAQHGGPLVLKAAEALPTASNNAGRATFRGA